MEATAHANGDDHIEEKESIWEVYLGTSGSSTVAFLWILFTLICIFSFLRWG